MQSVVFGGKEHERLEIAVHGYERAESGDVSDDNWLRIVVSIHSGGFRGGFHASFLTGELVSFLDEIATLHETLIGEAKFRTLEEQLSLSLRGDGLGHIELRGEALDLAGIGNRLCFTLHLDQSQLKSSLSSLRALVEAYPVRT